MDVTEIQQMLNDGTIGHHRAMALLESLLTPVPGAEPQHDSEGNEILDIATCGHCLRSWNDAAISSLTPAPSGRCPFEYDHEY